MQYALSFSGGKDSTLALDRARREGLDVAYLFNIYDRLADSFSFHLPGPDGYAASGRSLMKRGYRL